MFNVPTESDFYSIYYYNHFEIKKTVSKCGLVVKPLPSSSIDRLKTKTGLNFNINVYTSLTHIITCLSMYVCSVE